MWRQGPHALCKRGGVAAQFFEHLVATWEGSFSTTELRDHRQRVPRRRCATCEIARSRATFGALALATKVFVSDLVSARVCDSNPQRPWRPRIGLLAIQRMVAFGVSSVCVAICICHEGSIQARALWQKSDVAEAVFGATHLAQPPLCSPPSTPVLQPKFPLVLVQVHIRGGMAEERSGPLPLSALVVGGCDRPPS